MGKNLHADFKIRIPAELKEKIRQSAEQHNRSMTADIIARVEQSFATEEQARPLVATNQQWLEEMGISKEEFATAIKTIVANALK